VRVVCALCEEEEEEKKTATKKELNNNLTRRPLHDTS